MATGACGPYPIRCPDPASTSLGCGASSPCFTAVIHAFAVPHPSPFFRRSVLPMALQNDTVIAVSVSEPGPSGPVVKVANKDPKYATATIPADPAAPGEWRSLSYRTRSRSFCR